jgi:NADPH2:quinone reductase
VLLTHFSAVNPLDQKTRDMGLFFKKAPQVLAHDIAGRVVKMGPTQETSKFNVGDNVFAHANFVPGEALTDCGGLQQYAIVDSRYAAKVDEAGLTDIEASTFAVCAMAAFIAFFHSTGFGLPIPPSPHDGPLSQRHAGAGKAILIIGGGTNCGRFAVQFARMCGFEQIITTVSPRKIDELQELGATHVIDRHANRDDLVRQIRAMTGDELVYALDTINMGAEQDLGLAALSNSKKGSLITLNPVNEEKPDPSFIGEKTAGYSRRLTFGFSALYPDVSTVFWDRIPAWVRAGQMRPLQFKVIEGLNVVKINQALDDYRGGHGQKPVVRL